MKIKIPAPPTVDVPLWVYQLAHGAPLPPEPSPRFARRWGGRDLFLLGLTSGLGVAYLGYHFVQPAVQFLLNR